MRDKRTIESAEYYLTTRRYISTCHKFQVSNKHHHNLVNAYAVMGMPELADSYPDAKKEMYNQ